MLVSTFGLSLLFLVIRQRSVEQKIVHILQIHILFLVFEGEGILFLFSTSDYLLLSVFVAPAVLLMRSWFKNIVPNSTPPQKNGNDNRLVIIHSVCYLLLIGSCAFAAFSLAKV